MSANVNLSSRSRPSAKLRKQATLLMAYVLLLAGSAAALGFDPLAIVREFHHVHDVLDRAWPPNVSLLWERPQLYASIMTTLCAAFLGTLMGGLSALGLAVLMASNTTPHPWLRFALQTVLGIQRAVPTFVIMLMMQVAVGIGTFSTVLALVAGTVGMFGKLFAEDLETVDRGPVDAVAALGANRMQRIQFAILPAAKPSLLAHGLYAFDINIRMAIALGVFGGGGIGFEFYLSQKLLRHDDMLALALAILLLVAVTEKVSNLARRRILSDGLR